MRRRTALAAVVVAAMSTATLPWTLSNFNSVPATRAQVVSTPAGRFVGLATLKTSGAVSYTITGLNPGSSTDALLNLVNDGSTPREIAESVTTSTTSPLDTDATYGLRVQIDTCNGPWQQSGATATCPGTTTSIVAPASLATVTNVPWTALTNVASKNVGGLDHLRVRFSLPSGAPPSYSSLTSKPTVTLWGAPSAPQAVTAVPGDGQIAVSWSAPTNTDSPVSSYTATASPSGKTCPVSAPTATCTITGLTDGATQSVTVTATDGIGAGPPSVAVLTTPYPALLTSAGASLWLDGADPSTKFASTCGGALTVGTGPIGCWKDKHVGSPIENFSQTTDSAPPSGTLNGLGAVNFTSASQVLTSADTGGTYQTVFAAVRPIATSNGFDYLFGRAGADFNVRIATANLTSGINDSQDWSYGTGPPLLDWSNGRQATDITTGTTAIISAQSASAQSTYATSVSNSFNSGGSRRGVIGSVGEIIAFSGALSTTDRRTVEDYLGRKWNVPLTPDAPGTLTAAPGNTTATFSWSPPADTGQPAVSGYSVVLTPGGSACTMTGATSCTASGLANGQTYSATVAAVNSIGTGASSATVSFIPSATVPGAPTGVAFTPGSGALTVGWSAPVSNGGSAILSYTATANPGPASCSSNGPTTCQLTGLTNGTSYAVTVTATNGAGTGPASVSASGTPNAGGPAKPGAPAAVSLVPGDTTILASWSAPPTNGNSTISGYMATASPGGATCSTTTTLTCPIPGLTDATTYSVTVTATNGNGIGPASNPATATPYPATVMNTGSGLSLWLDASDPTTIYPSSACTGPTATPGAPVSCWTDKSGTAENFTQQAPSSPPTASTLNNLGSLGFANSGQVLTALSNDTLRTIFVAVVPGGSAGNFDTMFAQAGADFSLRLNGQMSSPSSGDWGYNNGATALDWTNGRQAFDPAITPAARDILSAQSSSPFPTTFLPSVSTTYGSRGLTGTIGEIIGFSGVLTTAQRRTVEDYLAKKWGVTLTPDQPGTPVSVGPGGLVSWVAPPWNGGSAVTSYTPTVSQGGVTCAWTAGTQCQLGGSFTYGASYSVTVTASNGIGTGPASNVGTVTPYPAVMSSASGLSLWLDAADPTTLYPAFLGAACTGTNVTTGNVGCWLDKSGTGENFQQSTSSAQPTVDTLNSKGAVNFIDANRVLTSANPTGSYQTIFTAMWPAATASGYDYIFGLTGSDYNLRLVSNGTLGPPNSEDWAGNGNGSSQWANGRAGATIPPPPLLGVTDLLTAQSQSVVSSSVSLSNPNAINPSRGMVGKVGEVIAFKTTLTTAQRRSVEDYLAHKWAVSITPDQPGAPTVAAASKSLTVTNWAVPAWNGGQPITGYTATAVNGASSSTCAASAPSPGCTITGLTAGTAYSVTVTATNTIGVGAISPAATGTPTA